MLARSLGGSVLYLALLLALAGCPSPLPEPEPADEIFTKNPADVHVRETLIINPDGSSTVCRVPNNQIMLMFAADVPVDRAASTIRQMQTDLAGASLSLVGQIPDLGIYQLEMVNELADPAAAMDALDTVIEQLGVYPGVAAVGYNELLKGHAVENDDDNSALRGYDYRCALGTIDYYQAIPILDRVLPHIDLSDVTVAVIDSGLWVQSGQFDTIMPRTQFTFPVDQASPPYDFHLEKHGTNIAGLLAADNGDGLTNGIALRILGDRLHLIIGDAHIWGNDYSLARCISESRQAVLLGADIVNLSVGRGNAGGRPRDLLTTQRQFDRLFTASPDVLFVAAASNDRLVLNRNDAPAGMPNPNLLTVGGFSGCNPHQRFFDSATGPGIEIAAPATNIPAIAGDNMFGPALFDVDGNSFAAAIVSAIAAIVKSIDPDLTPAELKSLLLDEDQTWSADATVSGRRPALIKTVATVLLNRAGGGVAVDKILDAFGPADDISDPSGYSVNRLCGQIEFTLAGPSLHETVSVAAPEIAWSADMTNYGTIGMPHQVNLTMGAPGSPNRVQVKTTAGFRLNEPYAGQLGIEVGALHTGIDGGTGLFTCTECELTTRSLPLDWFSPDRSGPHQLVFIEVSGTFSGTNHGALRVSDGELIHGVSYSASGRFTTAFMLIYPEADTLEYLERNCVGGYLFEVP